MKRDDPARPTLGNATSCWEGGMLFLPSWVTVGLTPDGRWKVGLLNGEKGCHDDTIVSDADLPTLLAEWRDDPEAAFRKWWGASPPSHINAQAGVDGYVRGPGGRVGPSAIAATNVSLDDF